MAVDSWGFAHDPDTDLGEPIAAAAASATRTPSDGPESAPLSDGPRRAPRSVGLLLLGFLTVWIAASFAVAIPAQYAAGLTEVDWRLGLGLAAISFGGGIDITTHHWALHLSHGVLLPGCIGLGAWGLLWALRFHHLTSQSGVPLRPNQVGYAAVLGVVVYTVVVGIAAVLGALIRVGNTQVWVSPSLAQSFWGALAIAATTGVVGVWFLGWIPTPIRPILRTMLAWLLGLGAVVGVIVLAITATYGAHPLALILLAPSLWASGIALGTGAPIMVQFTESTTQLHATWGMMGVTGTLPHPAALPLALGAVVGTTVILTIGVRDVIKALGTRRASVWVIGSGLILWAIALSTSMVGVRNVVAGTTPPPVVEWIASTLHNGMHASTGAQWAITALVSWPIAMGTLLVVMGVATGLGIAAAGPPSAPWSGQELEDSLRRVYKAGLIDQAAFDRGHYRLSQAKKNAKRPTRHQP